jgi:hypothetical protein
MIYYLGTIYRLTYDGIDFQLARPYSDEFNNKYKIEIGEYIVVPPNTQYWLYGDINIRYLDKLWTCVVQMVIYYQVV